MNNLTVTEPKGESMKLPEAIEIANGLINDENVLTEQGGNG